MSSRERINSVFYNNKRLVVILGLFVVLIFIVSTVNRFIEPPVVASEAAPAVTNSVVDKPTTIPKKIICLDPGHGGKDAGAIYGSIYESNINLIVANKVKSILEKNNYLVYSTRLSDVALFKRDRSRYCNSVKADIMVSIHHNSYDADHTVDYSTALYYKESDKLLASSILSATSNQLNTRDQGIAKFDDSLLWVATMPAALSEAFFITNKSEYSQIKLVESGRLSDEASGIATGIVDYFDHPDQALVTDSSDSLMIDRADLGD